MMPTISEQGDVSPDDVDPTPSQGAALLEIRDVSVRFGGVHALEGVTFGVPAGSLTGLIGPNGAGKSTLIDAICGVVPASGVVVFEGHDLRGLRPHVRARRGLARVFQSGELCDDLTVLENVVVGPFRSRRRRADHARDVLQRLQLDADADRHVDELSTGRRRLVAIARALAQEPRLLLLDEPAAGLDSRESDWLGQQLIAVRDSGVTIVMIEHDLQLLMRICDHLHVLNFGRLIASGPPAVVARHPEVVAAYLGGAHVAAEPA
ncbi:ABC transporter ATP-binding protein [Desertimonas flava]|uniref:ABC transporter ATP-binding protein n=1 Tax=Desertimonas flava TaxID=2064846 RepID=UPI001968B040|nr:ABC transporter ATP-binding protein [Desertimonas flava]